MDFVHDRLATDRKLPVLTIIDTFSRFSPALEPRFGFSGAVNHDDEPARNHEEAGKLLQPPAIQ
jgi:hypothetical protein